MCGALEFLDTNGGSTCVLPHRWPMVVNAMCGALEVLTRVAEVRLNKVLGKLF